MKRLRGTTTAFALSMVAMIAGAGLAPVAAGAELPAATISADTPVGIAAVDICNVQVSISQRKPGYRFTGGGVEFTKRDCYQNDVNYVVAATRAIQVSYNNCYADVYGYGRIATDGIYGPATIQAVWNVQSRHGLSADGLYGPVTAGSMKFLEGSSCQPW